MLPRRPYRNKAGTQMVQAAPGFEPGERGWQANTLSPAPPGDLLTRIVMRVNN